MNLSFVGCGFLGTYHLGVATCFKAYAPYALNKASGSSCGSVVAASILVGAPFHELATDLVKGCVDARKKILGPFSPTFDLNMSICESLDRLFPEDAHIRASGKLYLSLTNIYDGKNILVSKYSSREELINVVLASCYVPMLSGVLPPRYRGSKVIDGFYSNNLPVLDSQTITVSPFCGAADICPLDSGLEDAYCVNFSNMGIEMTTKNAMRMYNVLLPPDSEAMAMYYKQGFKDACRFIQQRNIISSTQFLDIASIPELDLEEVHGSAPPVKYKPVTGKSETMVAETIKGVLEALKENGREENSFSYNLLKILFYLALLYFSGILVQTLVPGQFDWSLDLTQTFPEFSHFLFIT